MDMRWLISFARSTPALLIRFGAHSSARLAPAEGVLRWGASAAPQYVDLKTSQNLLGHAS